MAERAKRRRSGPKTAERLARMLVIVPYVVQHPGAELAEVASLFEVAPAQLRRDLDLLFMSGLPPYGPGDLIDVDVDEDDRVWITMADHFARPLRLTRTEALALYLRGTELMATPGMPGASALAGALEKLRGSLGEEALGEAEGRIEVATRSAQAPEHLAQLRDAARKHQRLRIEYFAASTGAWTKRTIEPEEVFSSLGNWYVAAWDLDADDERLFRADRIRQAADTGESFSPRGLAGAGRMLFTPSEQDVLVRLRLHSGARWIAEYLVTTDPVERDDGSLDVTLPAKQLGWVAALLLRVDPDAEILDPPGLADEVRDLAERTLSLYREGSPGARP
ncbi:MAG: WYL domain-containing protein [Actinomycetota bacterium]|nr:WYL domain-containing protein [Actinomycetota bacterium]